MPEQQTISTEILRTLHRIHRQLNDLKERLQRGPKQIKASQANVSHRESLCVQSKNDNKTFHVSLDHKQLQLKTAEARVKDLKIKLNTAQSNREYQTLLEQIQAAEMANSVLADEILEALDTVDQYKKNMEHCESDLAAARQRSEQIGAEVAKQEPLMRGDLARLEAELKKAEAALPAEVREHYARVVRHRGEDALAAVENQCCGGCHQKVPLNLCTKILMNQPVFCKSCGRMLYMNEENKPVSRKE